MITLDKNLNHGWTRMDTDNEWVTRFIPDSEMRTTEYSEYTEAKQVVTRH